MENQNSDKCARTSVWATARMERISAQMKTWAPVAAQHQQKVPGEVDGLRHVASIEARVVVAVVSSAQ